MIIKGKVRGNGKQLGAYLLSDPKNDRATILESRGFELGSLEDQLTGAEALTLANTRARSAFYFTAFRPAPGETLTREQAMWGIERLEQKLGLEDVPRVVVSQVFKGEEHFHAVWNHYDAEAGKMRDIKFDARARLEVAAEMEERFNLRRLNREGFDDRGHARQWEDGQDERSAKGKAERAAEITGLWNSTDSGKAFRAALETEGYTLAHGKSRAFCVVDQAGEVHSLARQIRGATTGDVKARLADLEPSSIPDAEAIRADLLQARRDRQAPASGPATARATFADRQAAREADSADIRNAEALYEIDTGPRVATPRERTKAEREASAGLASTILNNLTWGRSTFTRADLEREAAKMTGHQGRESWMAQTGGLDVLDDRHRASAERSYEKWAEENPHAAEKYGLEEYVSYTQDREAARQAEVDPASLQQRSERRAAFMGIMEALEKSGEIVAVGPDPRNAERERFTTRSMLRAELEMEAAAATLADRGGHAVTAKTRDTARKQTEQTQGFDLSGEQRAALAHVTGSEDIALVVGYAGAGKSTMLNAARGAWEAQGFRVQGTALSGIAARGLEESAGIESVNLHRLLHRLDGQEAREASAGAKIEQLEEKIGRIRGKSDKAQQYRGDLTRQLGDLRQDVEKGHLTARDVVVVDEAAMIGSRQMGRLLTHVEAAGAKIVLVGDHEQVQAVEAGAAYRALMERHGAAVMKDIRRQSADWQREATKAFPEGRSREALDAYRDHGMTHETGTRDEAKAAIIAAWSEARQARPENSSVILTHRNADVHDLNQLGRAAFRAEGRLGADHELKLNEGSITLAEGDRLLFKKNDGHLDVRNGSLATVRKVEGETITVALDTAKGKAGQGKEISFKLADYQEFSHGYAATIHKTQGATVDRAFVLATPGMDKNTAYVAMSRHREQADLYHAKEDFKDHDAMTRRLARNGAKDSVLDYLQRAEQGQGFASTFRAAVSGLWDKITGAFRRGDHHPAEIAQQTRERAVQEAKRPAETLIDTLGVQAEKDRQAGTSRAADQTDAAKKEAAEEGRRKARAEDIARLREAERKRHRDDINGPGGRGG